ncbi:hypothetical protein YPPY34_2495, partial [Yersinia pestis PY-34]
MIERYGQLRQQI